MVNLFQQKTENRFKISDDFDNKAKMVISKSEIVYIVEVCLSSVTGIFL